jgi:hypothetical protein
MSTAMTARDEHRRWQKAIDMVYLPYTAPSRWLPPVPTPRRSAGMGECIREAIRFDMVPWLPQNEATIGLGAVDGWLT